MASKNFSSIEIDAIGEIMNISLGASATAISTMLDARVNITTPSVQVVTKENFTFKNLEPAVGVEINYISGLEGKNVMLLKRHDVKVIIGLLTGIDVPDEEFVLDEMNVSAICEVMNQMMGASSTALSEFLGEMVNISTPQSFEVANENAFKEIYFKEEDQKLVVRFVLNIDGRMESEFVNVMSVDLAKDLVKAILPPDITDEEEASPQPAVTPASGAADLGTSDLGTPLMDMPGMGMSNDSWQNPQPTMQTEFQQPMQAGIQQPEFQQTTQQIPAYGMPQSGSMDGYMAQQMQMMQQMQQMQMMLQQYQNQAAQASQVTQAPAKENKVIHTTPLPQVDLHGRQGGGEAQPENLKLVMGVSLEVSVVIGKTHSMVKDILEYTKGTLVVLDKQAGDQVDLFVNGQCIARGDVVVVDDNFGIRITEILKRPELI